MYINFIFKSSAGEQQGAKWPESLAFWGTGKYLLSLDYDISANIPYILNKLHASIPADINLHLYIYIY